MVAGRGQCSIERNEWPGTASNSLSTVAEAEGPTALLDSLSQVTLPSQAMLWALLSQLSTRLHVGSECQLCVAVIYNYIDLKTCRKLPIILELFPVLAGAYYSRELFQHYRPMPIRTYLNTH